MALKFVRTEPKNSEEYQRFLADEKDSCWFSNHYDEIKENYRGKYIAVVNEEFFVGETAEEVERKARVKYPHRDPFINYIHYRSIDILGIDTSRIEVRDDVGGVGGYGVPYFRHPLELKIVSAEGNAIFSGDVNVFLDPHATRFPILGRDVLDNFVVIFDRFQNNILFLRKPDTYQIIRG